MHAMKLLAHVKTQLVIAAIFFLPFSKSWKRLRAIIRKAIKGYFRILTHSRLKATVFKLFHI